MSFLEFYAGVFALVLLTATVALGLLTTERVFLSPSNRVRAQLAHRATAMIGMAYLVTHVTLMVSLGHVSPIAVVVPMTDIYVGLGAVAFDMMIVVVVSGMIRGRFAVSAKPWMWRMLHATSYMSWPVAIMHGLTAGRAPADYVTWSYVACLAAVGAALLVRVLATIRRPAVLPDHVEVPEINTQPVPVPEEVNAPVSLDAARRKYREAG